MAICIECDEEYPKKRYELGYLTCLECGNNQATKEIKRKSKQVAPHYSKGAYQYITPGMDLSNLGRKL